jgi:hypothetical protein
LALSVTPNTYFPVSFFLQTRKYQTFVRTGTLGPPVWTTFAAVALQGEEGAGGVRVVIAKLIDAMTPYIGRDTGGMQHVNVQLD